MWMVASLSRGPERCIVGIYSHTHYLDNSPGDEHRHRTLLWLFENSVSRRGAIVWSWAHKGKAGTIWFLQRLETVWRSGIGHGCSNELYSLTDFSGIGRLHCVLSSGERMLSAFSSIFQVDHHCYVCFLSSTTRHDAKYFSIQRALSKFGYCRGGIRRTWRSNHNRLQHLLEKDYSLLHDIFYDRIMAHCWRPLFELKSSSSARGRRGWKSRTRAACGDQCQKEMTRQRIARHSRIALSLHCSTCTQYTRNTFPTIAALLSLIEKKD